MLKHILIYLLLGLLGLIGVLLFNTFRFTSLQEEVPQIPALAIPDSTVSHFQQAIRFKTISYADSTRFDSSQFRGLHRLLEQTYPLVHQHLKKEVIGGYSLLYTWVGLNSQLPPAILMAHQDVVPIEEETRNLWEVDPFGGVIKDGFIWGRGTVDDKINLISQLEALERLLSESFKPQRTLYLAFGHDEEVSGMKGAAQIAALLKSRGVKAAFVLDEGGIITLDKVPGLKGKPVALIGTSEKGYLSLELSVSLPGGHSSMPEKETAIDLLTRAIVKLRENPFPADFSPSTQEFMRNVGPEQPFFLKLIFANQWLFKPIVIGIYESSAPGNAIVRTTIAPTILHSGIKDNVVPTLARATVNFRILPGTTSQEVINRVKEVIDDERIKVEVTGLLSEPSGKQVSADNESYKKLIRHIRQNVKGTITTPFLMIGATDSRYFQDLTEATFKFSPMVDPIGFHGLNERIDIDSYKRCIGFYYQLVKDN
jgi:carboxypeptidase PM20D1